MRSTASAPATRIAIGEGEMRVGAIGSRKSEAANRAVPLGDRGTAGGVPGRLEVTRADGGSASGGKSTT